MSDKDDPLKSLDFARRQLRVDPNELDADTREKLMKIRHLALESSLEGKSSFPDWATIPILAFVTALIFIVLLYVKPKAPPIDEGPEDLEILLSNDPIEFYENIEFLQKLKNQGIASEEENN